MENESHSVTRTASFTFSRSPIARSLKSQIRRVARFVTTPGRRAEISSRSRWPNQNQFCVGVCLERERRTSSDDVTDDYFNAYNPAWDPQGNYLYFLSDREFAPQLSNIEFNYATNRPTYIYAMALRKDVKHPFPPESDEVTIAKTDDSPKPAAPSRRRETGRMRLLLLTRSRKQKPDAAPKPPATMNIDFDGHFRIASRVFRLALTTTSDCQSKPDICFTSLVALVITAARAIALRRCRSTRSRIARRRRLSTTFVVTRFLTMARRFSSHRDRATTFTMPRRRAKDRSKAVATSGLYVDRVPAEEWNQIFNEVWRRYRDWFYVSNMHGFDWVALREQYKPLLKYVAHRSDLNYVISEMIAELTVQHAYIDGGDFQIPPRPRSGLPGARFEFDQQAGRYRIAKIFGGENEEDIYRSPLTEVGVNASVGDYVLAIDGEELKANDDPYRLLRNKADNPVQLTLNKTPSMQGARTVSYRPITDEQNLIYLDWVDHNREKVSEGDEWTRWLSARSRHGRERNSRVYQVVLPATQEGSADRRRACEWRRQRFAYADRASATKSAGAELLAHQRRCEHLSRRRLHWTDGGAAG